MNEFGNDEQADKEQDEANEVTVPRPSVGLPQGFTPLVPGSALDDLEDLPESSDDDGEVGEVSELSEPAGEEEEKNDKEDGELVGPDVESIFAKVVAESDAPEADEEDESKGFEGVGVGAVVFNAPKVKPVMLNAASVYGASPKEEAVEVESTVEEVVFEESPEESEEVEELVVTEEDEVVSGETEAEEEMDEESSTWDEEADDDDADDGIAEGELEDEVVAEEEDVEELAVTEEEELVSGKGEPEEEVADESSTQEEEAAEEVVADDDDADEADDAAADEADDDDVEDEEEVEVEEEVETEIEEEEVLVAEGEDVPDEDEVEAPKKSVLEILAENDLEEVAAKLPDDDDDDDEESEGAEEEELGQKVPDAAVVAGLVAKAKANQSDDSGEMEVMDPEREKTRELFQPEKTTSRWAFWRRPSKRDQQLARVSEGYLEMVDMVRAIRNQMNSQNENNLILRDSLSHLPEAMKGLESFSKSQRTVGKALKEIHGQLRNSGSKDQKLIESMTGFNDTLKGMDDTGRETMKTFDRVQERMRDSDIRMENLFQNVQNSEEKVSETMVRLQRNMANMQLIFLFCFMVVIGVLVYTVMGNNDEKEKTAPTPVKQEKVVTPPVEE